MESLVHNRFKVFFDSNKLGSRWWIVDRHKNRADFASTLPEAHDRIFVIRMKEFVEAITGKDFKGLQ